MLIKVPKGWEIPERDVTPESIYRNRPRGEALGASRRQFLAAAGASIGAGVLAGSGLDGMSALAAAPVDLPSINAPRNDKYKVEGRSISPESITAGFNNFYEYTLDKQRVAELAADFTPRPWQIEIRGQVEKKIKIDVDELIKKFPLEERVYRLRCVEAWSIVVPWAGFPMAKLVEFAKPTSKAKFIRTLSVMRPGQCPGQRAMPEYNWPYYEGMRLDEATNELAMIVVGSYGHILPNQNGAPLRIITPWKYGYKSIKAITVFEFTDRQPPTFWNDQVPSEYTFVSNVDPSTPHPRWSQATEQVVGERRRIPTLPYNGYAEYVAHLYK